MTMMIERFKGHRHNFVILFAILATAVLARSPDRYTGTQAAEDWAHQARINAQNDVWNERQDVDILTLQEFLGVE